MKAPVVLLLTLLLTVTFLDAIPASAYSPHVGDFFHFSESIVVNNGQGSYAGYSDQTQVTGMEQVSSTSGNNVTTSYLISYQFSSSQESTTSNTTSSHFVWSSSSYTYTNGTDNQKGYSKPIHVWFAMNPSLPAGGKFYALNTQFTVISKNYSYELPGMNATYVRTIEAKGNGVYERDDDYGLFQASYTWTAYYDPSTGYIVGYNYVEQDNGQYNGLAGSFTYTDNLFVTSTSYVLTLGSPPGASTSIGQYLGLLAAVVVVLLIIVVLILIGIRMRKRKGSLPQHSKPPYTPTTPPAQWESKVDLGSRPSEQVVIREVAKVNCKYCGTLIPTTADNCPYCGAPRQ